MARPPKNKTPDIDGDEPGDIDPDKQRQRELEEFAEVDEAEDGALFRITDEIRTQEGAMLQIVRRLPNVPGKRGFVGEMSPQEFTTKRMADLYGPGTYRVRIMGPRGFLKGGGTLEIAESTNPKPPGSVNDVQTILTSLDEREARRKDEEDKRRERMMTIWAGVATAVGPALVAALFGKKEGMDIPALIAALKPNPGPTMAELTTTLQNLRGLSGDDKRASELDLFMRGMEFMKDQNGGDREPGFMDLLKEAAGPLIASFTGGKMPRPIALMPRPPMQIPPNGGEPQQTNTPQTGENAAMLQLLGYMREQLDMLVTQASRNKDPELYAELLLDNIPEGLDPRTLVNYLKRPDWWKMIVQFHPTCAPFEVWFTALRNSCVEMAEGELRQTTPEESQQTEAPNNG